MSDKQTDPLAAKLDEGYPESWVAEKPGDQITGYVVRVERGHTTYGIKPILILRTDDGELRSVWVLNDVLANALRRLRPVPGERVAIRFDGKRTAKNPRPGTSGEYNDFKVAVDRPEEASTIDWDSTLGPEVEAVPVSETDEVPF